MTSQEIKNIVKEINSDIHMKVNRVLNSSKLSLDDLKDNFREFSEYSDVFVTVAGDSFYVHYTYTDDYGEMRIESVSVPDDFILDFHTFMRNHD